MQRSSDSIAQLAAALAKAQIELVNPEKSLEATIYPEGAGSEGRSFNYASLASGLEIVRKTLGQHEIATVQTTALDPSAGIVNLTTVLAHASGEWIASEWPVCAITDTAAPHRMGAALTYARRYALFTLVGIAGEDDLDAPDLPTPKVQPSRTPKSNGLGGASSRHVVRSRSRMYVPRQQLALAESSALRDRLLGEINAIKSGDDAALWAYCNLHTKDSLTGADAQHVEEAFQSKLAVFAQRPSQVSVLGHDVSPEGTAREEGSTAVHNLTERSALQTKGTPSKKRRGQIKAVDKSVLAFPEPRRVRDREHVRYVATQPCLVCGRVPCDAHHLRFTQSRALARKVSDEFTVPLCRGHHREVHCCGGESAWWEKLGIAPATAARALWLNSHPLPFEQNSSAGRPEGGKGARASGSDRSVLGFAGRSQRRKRDARPGRRE